VTIDQGVAVSGDVLPSMNPAYNGTLTLKQTLVDSILLASDRIGRIVLPRHRPLPLDIQLSLSLNVEIVLVLALNIQLGLPLVLDTEIVLTLNVLLSLDIQLSLMLSLKIQILLMLELLVMLELLLDSMMPAAKIGRYMTGMPPASNTAMMPAPMVLSMCDRNTRQRDNERCEKLHLKLVL
jgi:hypothetical protein